MQVQKVLSCHRTEQDTRAMPRHQSLPTWQQAGKQAGQTQPARAAEVPSRTYLHAISWASCILVTGPTSYPLLPLPGGFRVIFLKKNVRSKANYSSYQFVLWFMETSCTFQVVSATLKFPHFSSDWNLRESTGRISVLKPELLFYLQSQPPFIRSHQQLQQCTLCQ